MDVIKLQGAAIAVIAHMGFDFADIIRKTTITIPAFVIKKIQEESG